MRDFNRFINAILENKLLRSSELVEQFLTKTPEEFHVIKLKYKNVPKVVNMKDFPSLTGELDLTNYKDKFHSSEYILQNIEKKRNILKEINTNLKSVTTCMENLNKYMTNLSHLFLDLKKEYENQYNKFESLDSFGKFCKNISSFYNEKKNFWETKIREFFKYINLELKEVKDLCNQSKYANINLKKCESCLINYKSDKNNNLKTAAVFNYELQKRQIEKQNAQRTCNFLINKTFEELQKITYFHNIRFRNYLLNEGRKLSDILSNEFKCSNEIFNQIN
jgi:hypothetical protein